MIFGLGAALGWGFADLLAAIAGRRIGAFATVVVAQTASMLGITVVFVLVSPDTSELGRVAAWVVPSSVLTAGAYFTLYRALELGPVAVVSPVLAAYAIFPVLLAVALLGESLEPLQTAGVATTIGGAVLTSTDLRSLRAGTHAMPLGLPWAVVSAVLFGIGTYTIGWASQHAGWLPSLWVARVSTGSMFALAAVVAMAVARRTSLPSLDRGALLVCLALGFVDLVGTVSYSRGAEVGLVSVVTAVSATYPLIPVFGGIAFFGERPAPNQYLGVAMVIGGLALLG